MVAERFGSKRLQYSRPARLRDVADRAGVSTASVSRVLNSTGRVRPALRQRVEQALAELDYVPNAAAQALVTQRSRTIGAVVPTLDIGIFSRGVEALQQRLADAMWRWVRPGGGVLWYDFTVDNPRNPDVRGIALARVRRLFPQAALSHERVTLAPPLARAVTRLHPGLYTVFNLIPLLRTHLLAWAQK